MNKQNNIPQLALGTAKIPASLTLPRMAVVLIRVCGALVIGIALLAIIGWLNRISWLASFGTNLFPMAPSTTISFLAYGGSLILLASSHNRQLRYFIILMSIGLVPVLTRLIEFTINVDLGFIELELPPVQNSFSLAPTGRMAFPTAISFVFTACAMVAALFAPSKKPIRYMAIGISAAVMVVGLTFLLGYAYGLPLLRNTSSIPMALNTSIAFLLLGIGLSVLGIGYEIADRRRVTEALSSLATIIESSQDAIISFTPNGIIKTWNTSAERMYGYNAEEAIEQPISMLSLPENVTLLQTNLESLNRGECVASYETTLKHKTGRLIEVSASAFPLHDAHGGVIASASIHRNITDRKMAEMALHEIEERHRAILHSAMDGFWLVNTQGSLIDVNEAYCRMSGYSAQELLTMGVTDLESVETRVDTAAHIQKILAQGEDRFESRHRRKDGSIYDIEVSVQYRPFQGGQFVAFVRDITERKRAATALQDSEEKFRQMAESFDDVVRLSDPGITKMLFINSAYERLWGRSRESLYESPQSFLDLIHPEDRDRILANLEQHAQGIWDVEYRIVRPDGSVRWIRDKGFPIRDEQGGICRMTCIAADVTERVQAAMALRQSEEKARALFESSPAGIVVVDHLGRIVLVNAATENLFGYRREELLGHSVEILMPMQHRSSHVDKRASYNRSPETQQMGLDRDIQARKKDGTEFMTEIGLSPIQTGEGKFTMAFIVDISARKRVEAEQALDMVRTQALLDLHKIESSPQEQLFDFVLEASLKITQSELSFIGLIDEAESVMTIHNWSKQAMAQCAMTEKPVVYPLREAGLWGDCVRQRKPLVINDYGAPHKDEEGFARGTCPDPPVYVCACIRWGARCRCRRRGKQSRTLFDFRH